MHVADTLSRAYLNVIEGHDSEEMEVAVHTLTANLPISDSRKAEFRSATESDVSLQHVKKLTNEGWPTNLNNVPEPARPFWKVRDELHITDGLIFAGERLVVPQVMNKVALQVIHEGHMGIEKCKQRARSCLYWPSMNTDVENLVNGCEVCNKFSPTIRKEPMIPYEVPSRPWEKVGVDYFTIHNKDFLLIVDYYSKYPEVIAMASKTAAVIIKAMQVAFSRHRIPSTVIADNMPFNSSEFLKFVRQWHFSITTSPQSNGLIECNVQTIKRLFKKAMEDNNGFDLALLEYRNTPISGMDLSPAQLLMSIRLRSTLPMTHSLLTPTINEDVTEQLKDRQEKQQVYYNRPLSPLSGDTVQYKTGKSWRPAVVICRCLEAPRSYLIKNDNNRTIRRNRRHLKKTPRNRTRLLSYDDDDNDTHEDDHAVHERQQVPNCSEQLPSTEEHLTNEPASRVSQYRRPINPPQRYIESTTFKN